VQIVGDGPVLLLLRTQGVPVIALLDVPSACVERPRLLPRRVVSERRAVVVQIPRRVVARIVAPVVDVVGCELVGVARAPATWSLGGLFCALKHRYSLPFA